MNKKALSLAVFIAISYPGSSFALGLGEIESASHLNQPFKAKINLLSTNGSDVSQLKVKVASPSVFSRVGIDRPAYLNSLSFRSSIQNGKPVILVSSNQPIKEPFINFLLEVSWPKGQLLKEYTVLLDPPVLLQPGTSIASNTVGVRPDPVRVNQQQTQAANNQQAARQQQQRQRIIAQQQATRQQQQRQQQLQRQQQAQNTADGLRRPGPPVAKTSTPRRAESNTSSTYRVSRGDTLYKIAQKTGYQGVRTEQMMIALFEANPTAFRKRNINHLKAGVTMRRPSINEAKRISQTQARQEVRNQTAKWKSQRKTAATPTKKAPVNKAPTKTVSSGSSNNASQARIEVLGSTDGDRSVDSANLVGKPKLDALNRQLTLASESLTARTHENNELKSRVSELESLLRKKNRLITLKNEQLAELQVSLGEKPTAMMGNDDASDAVDPIGEQATGIQQAIVDQEGNEGAIVRTQDPADAIINDTQPEIFQPPVDEEPTITSAITPPTQPEEDNGILDLLSSPLVMGLGGGSLLALIGGLLFLRRRNAKDEFDEYSPIDFDDPSLAPGSSGFEDDVRAEPAQKVDASDDPFASPEDVSKDQFADDFQADPMEEFSTPDVAPAATVAPTAPIASAPADVDAEEDDILQEADVYIVYGLHEQAEVELKKAIAKQPDNLEYRAKLLENYHASDNKEAFEVAAAEFAQMQGPGKEALWDKVSSWGRKMIPASPVFAGPGVAAAIQSSAPTAPVAESDSGVGGLGLAAGAAALGGVAITAGKAIADNTQDGVEAIGDKAKEAVSDLTDEVPSFEDFTAETDDAQAEVLDFDDMDLDSLLSADSKDSEIPLDMPEAKSERVQLTEPAAKEPSSDSEIEEMDFDFSDFELGDAVEEVADPVEKAVVAETDKVDDLLDMSDFSDLDLDLGESTEDLIDDLDKNDFDATNLNLALDGSDTGLGKILPDSSVYKMSGDVAEKAKDDILGEIDDDLSFLDLDTAVGDDVVEAQVSTKLDLARAYMDMGDVDGARTTLEEVMAEGNDNQRKEAEELLQQTG